MYKSRWSLSLLIGIIAACSAPGTAIAPSTPALAASAGLNVRPIMSIAAALIAPTELSGLIAQPFSLVRSESGEQRIRQILTSADGAEIMRVESALDGSLRFVAKAGVALDGGRLSESAASAQALRHLNRLGLSAPTGGPAVSVAAGRILVAWSRQVRGVPVLNDGTRVVLNAAGALVGLAIEESPLAAPPSRIARSEAALVAAAALLPSGALLREGPDLAWVLPTDVPAGPFDERTPRSLAWCVAGVLRDGAAFAMQLDAGSLALLGWDLAP